MIFIEWIKKNRFVINVFITALIITLMIPNEGKFKYEYIKGRPWLYETLVAPIDIPILKNDAELRAERNAKASQVIPYYRYLDKIKGEQIVALMNLLDSGTNSVLVNNIRGSIEKIYDRGIVNEFADSNLLNKVIIIQKGTENYETPALEVFTKKSGRDFIKRGILEEFPNELYVNAISESKINQLLVPNLILDNNTTQLAHKSALNYISPTKGILYTGQQIVAKGETITADIEQLLDSYKAEYELSMGYSGNLFLLKLGHFISVSGILILFVILLHFLKREVLLDHNKLNFMMLQVVIVVLVTVIIKRINPEYLYVVPYSVIALYITSFFTSKIVLPIYLIFLLPVVLIAQSGYEIFFMNALAGGVVIFTFTYWNRSWLQFINSLVVFISLVLSYVSFRLIEYGSFTGINPAYFLYFLWNSILIIASYPLIFLFEKVFGLVSNTRLRDMSDTTSPLLQTLSEKAPGTFQHSLQVATLAESAARKIGAYALLARVGALYHDVGKMTTPHLFIENQKNGEVSLHSTLSPVDSAKLIIHHVDEGVELARRARIPQIVIDFILSHHGQSKTIYFYNQFVNQGGDPSRTGEFTYNGILPKYKEQVIVMMADTVEAASRTLKDYSEESISALVERVIDARISENQLINAEISIREIVKVKEVFKQKLLQVYHSRISYPVMKNQHSQTL
ncbi:MAG: HDIG domain-containing metalloprotein [Bacteroidales bacterium]